MKSGCRSCALAAASSSALGINRRKITHTSTSIWAMPGRSAAPIALHYSVSIRAWAQTKPIRQIVLTLTWTELKSSNAASLVMLPADNQRQAPLSRSLGAVHDWPRTTTRIRQDASLKTAEPTIAVARPRGPAPHASDRNILMKSLRLASSDRLPIGSFATDALKTTAQLTSAGAPKTEHGRGHPTEGTSTIGKR